MYRTPMDDSGHLWMRGTVFFRCGRYVEYPWYYEEGWDLVLNTPMWVQVDERKEKNNICAFCKASREAEAEQAKWDAEIEKAARKYGVTPVYPAAHRKSDPPRDIARWLPTKRMERLYVG